MDAARLLYVDAMVFVTLAMPTLLVAMALLTRPARAKRAAPLTARRPAAKPGWRGTHARPSAQPALRGR